MEGSLRARKFVATYHRDGRTVAVFALNNPKQFPIHRRRLSAALTRY